MFDYWCIWQALGRHFETRCTTSKVMDIFGSRAWTTRFSCRIVPWKLMAVVYAWQRSICHHTCLCKAWLSAVEWRRIWTIYRPPDYGIYIYDPIRYNPKNSEAYACKTGTLGDATGYFFVQDRPHTRIKQYLDLSIEPMGCSKFKTYRAFETGTTLGSHLSGRKRRIFMAFKGTYYTGSRTLKRCINGNEAY